MGDGTGVGDGDYWRLSLDIDTPTKCIDNVIEQKISKAVRYKDHSSILPPKSRDVNIIIYSAEQLKDKYGEVILANKLV